MIYRFFALIFGGLISLFSFNLNAQGFGIIIDSVEVPSGQDFCISVKTKAYTELFNLQLILSWDAQVIEFQKTKNYHLSGLSVNDFNIMPPNHLWIAWSDPAGSCVSRDSGQALFDICFSSIGPVGSNTLIKVDTGSVAGICLGIFGLTPVDIDTGIVTIGGQAANFEIPQNSTNTFQLYPNPTPSESALIYQSAKTGNATLLVSDTFGRFVHKQTVVIKTGENRFEIPANAMNNKGLYQVSLQTNEGVCSKMLSVQ